ncbi:unnamed protein product [Spirodela intermedia]|uniref:Uncharacterized protein n=1 Tax=Spirodela intermedia TaxID=51605 RepID=A0A7I8IM83_SPIIN|nr:unnamed protein product [Spirodela intermedia]CAA6659075.1 unnamed protein product [Spirodela intermedia]
MAEKMIVFLLLVSLPFFFCPILALGGDRLMPVSVEARNSTDSRLETYIVHVRKPEHMLSAGREELESWHKSFLPSPPSDSGAPRLVYSYERALSGFAARLTPEEVADMEAKEGFLFAYPDEPLAAETTWRYGMGMIVGVIDSGINPDHVSFGDNLFPDPPERWKGRCDLNAPRKCNKKLIGVRNFDSEGPQAEALDVTGNIVNVSFNGLADGIAAGAAPGGHLSIYRASMASGLVAAIDEAIRDRVDVICLAMTLPTGEFHRNDIAIATLSAVESGIFVSCAAGNRGPHRGSVRNDAPWVLTVGAGTMDRALRVILHLGDGEKYEGESLHNATMIPTGSLRLAHPSSCSSPLKGVVGTAVLCRSQPAAISPARQAWHVMEAGGAAMILMNDHLNGSTIVLADTALPTVAITYRDGQQLVSYFESARGSATVELLPMGTTYQAAPTPTVASFSGRGPSSANGGILKPDIIVSGVNILGPALSSNTGFAFSSGTSASAAILTSIAAMMRKNHTEWSPAVIRSAIMTSSDYLDNEMNPIRDETGGAASAFTLGAGHVKPHMVNDPGLVYDIVPEDYLRYLCGLGYTQMQVEAVARRGVDCESLGSLLPEQLNYPSIAVTLRGGRTTVTRTVRNEGPEASFYRGQVVGMPADVVVEVNPSELNFREKGEYQSFTVTFFYGGGAGGNQVYEGNLIWSAATSIHTVRTPLVVTVA